jgi:hypothetical protein
MAGEDPLRDCMDALEGVGRRLDALAARRRDRQDAVRRNDETPENVIEETEGPKKGQWTVIMNNGRRETFPTYSQAKREAMQELSVRGMYREHEKSMGRGSGIDPAIAAAGRRAAKRRYLDSATDGDELPMTQGEREAAFR